MRKISKRRIAFIAVTVIASVAGGYFFGDAIRAAEKPNEYIAVVFSILAASLFAVVSIVGDPGMLPSGSTSAAWVNARDLQKQLHRFNGLFFLYLITLGLLVVSEVIESSKWEKWYWVTDVYAGLAIGGFLLSFALPFDFMALQRRRLEQEIEMRSRGRTGQ
ncbi:hypothetical protein [Neorhizobium sp. DAR64872/K0K18]|uniref:hypothetical protein n=1 Tax=Neorhizobium sp. DAR64872/K0K18 TaxID=3421958 RepID=UPI003D2A844E